MTDDRMALAQLLEKGSDSDLLREMIGYVAQRLMQLDMDGLVGAAHGERGESRENWRNGYRERDWHTRSGTIALRIPSCAGAATFRGFWSRGGRRRRRWRRRCRKRTCKASRPARWTNW